MELNPIEGVSVAAENTTVSEISDINGEFTLDSLVTGTYDVSFSHPNYWDTTAVIIGVNPIDTTFIEMVMKQIPEIVAVTPATNELNTSVSSDISLTCDIDMDETTFNDSTCRVYSKATGFRHGSITYDSLTKTATFNPVQDFKNGDIITVVITTNVISSLSIPLDGAYTWSFTTVIEEGTGVFNPRTTYSSGDDPISLISADLDGDNDLDMVTANRNSDNISVLLNMQDSTFAAQVVYPVGDGPVSVSAGDLNHDYYVDLVTANNFSNNISVLLNNGDGTFLTATSYSAGASPNSVLAADLDGDGDIDLASANTGSANISIFLNNGDGSFASQIAYPAGGNPNFIFARDFDGNGSLDLATANAASDNISILFNDGDGGYPAYSLYGVGDGPISIHAADFDIVLFSAGCDYVTGNVNGSDSYNGLDITYGVAFFKGGPDPMCPSGSCPIPPCDAFFHCGDVNGSCNYNGLDITYGVSYLKGGAAPIPCGDCPPIGSGIVGSGRDRKEKPAVIGQSDIGKNNLNK